MTNAQQMKLKAVWNKLQWLNDEDFTLDFVRRDIALTIFEMKHHWTGYASTTICNEDGYKLTGKNIKKATDEHFLNMKKYTIQICTEFLEGKIDSIEKLGRKINQINQVHHVSSAENTALRKVQTAHPDKYWKEHYDMVGIELIKVRGLFNVDTNRVTREYQLDAKHNA